jgi:hypothetical protein
MGLLLNFIDTLVHNGTIDKERSTSVVYRLEVLEPSNALQLRLTCLQPLFQFAVVENRFRPKAITRNSQPGFSTATPINPLMWAFQELW